MVASSENTSYPQICLIDDDLISHLHLIQLLYKIDPQLKLISFLNADMALSYLEDQLESNAFPEVIFLNIYMPSIKETAWEVIDRLRALQEESIQNPFLKNIRMFFVTADELEGDRKKAQDYKMVREFWIKPVLEEKLREALATV
jgi:CheY-like chemotaxis protein